MNKAVFFATPFLLLAACGPKTDTDKTATQPAAETPKDEAAAKPEATPTAVAFVPPGNLNEKQKAIAIELHDYVLDGAIAGRLSEKCPEFSIDEDKFDSERARLLKAGRAEFKTADELLDAAGRNQQEAMSQELRQFYAKKNVEWDAPSADYCAVGKTLKGQATGPGRFLR